MPTAEPCQALVVAEKGSIGHDASNMPLHRFHFLAAALSGALLGALPAQGLTWWQKSFDEALTAAKDAKGGHVLLYFWRKDDGNCSSMFGGTFADAKVQAAVADYVCMGAEDVGATKALHEKFTVQKLPTVMLLDPTGKVVDVVVGYLPVQDFLGELQRIAKGEKTIAALEQAFTAKPTDLDLGLALHHKLRRSGDLVRGKAVLDAIIASDPQGKSEAAAEAALLAIIDEMFRPGVALADLDTKQLRLFAGKVKHKRVQFLAYDRLAAAEWKKDNLKEAVAAAEKAWKVIPPELVLDWGQNVAGKVYSAHEELDKINKTIFKRTVEVSAKALAEVEKRHQQNPDKVWLANALYLHAAVLVVANQRKEAFAAMDRAIELNPADENLKLMKARWVDGHK